MIPKSMIIKSGDFEFDINQLLQESNNCINNCTISESINSKIHIIRYLNKLTISILRNYKLSQLISDNLENKISTSEVMNEAFSKELKNNPYFYID